MSEKIGFLEEAAGVKSSTRLFSLLLLLFMIGFNVLWLVAENGIEPNFLMFNGLLLIGVFTPKGLQKIVEMKLNVGKGNGNGDK